METLAFDFGGKIIRVSTTATVSVKLWERIYETCAEIIHNAENELDATNPTSEAAKFNDAKTRFPIELSSPFQEFLQLNHDHYVASEGRFNPFEFIDFPPDDSLLEIRPEGTIKYYPAKLKNTLLTAHVLDQIDSVMYASAIKTYLISSPRHYIARGTTEWNIKFDHPIWDDDVELALYDSSIVMDTREFGHELMEELNQDKLDGNPFRNARFPTDLMGVILQHNQSQTQANVLTRLALHKSHKLEVLPIVKEAALNAWTVDRSGSIAKLTI